MYFLQYRFKSSACLGDYDYRYLGDKKPAYEESLESWGEDLAHSILYSGEGGDPADVRIQYDVVESVPEWWITKQIQYANFVIKSNTEYLGKLKKLSRENLPVLVEVKK